MNCILYTDGGARGNPGPAGAGVVIFAADGETAVFEAGYYLGETTNNVAEYTGLLRGLKAATRLGFQSIEVRTDSQLMARQLLGEYRPLYQEAIQGLEAFDQYEINHVLRNKNKVADQLANRAMDAKRDVIQLDASASD